MNNSAKNVSAVGFFIGPPWMIVYICEAFFILAGNLVTIYIFWKVRKTLKRTSYLLINLSVADLLVGLALSLQLMQDVEIVFGKEVRSDVRRSVTTVQFLSLSASLFSLALISLERMFAILWPFCHRVLETWYYFVSVGVVWLIAALTAAVSVSVVIFDGGRGSWATTVVIICSLLVITAAYSAIWIATKRNRMPSTASRSMVQNKKLARTLFIVTALSITAWLPSYIVIAFFSNGDRTTFHLFVVQITRVFQYSNSFINPIVYCFRMVEFKKCLNNIFCRCPQKRQSTDHIPTDVMKGITLASFRTVNSVYSL